MKLTPRMRDLSAFLAEAQRIEPTIQHDVATAATSVFNNHEHFAHHLYQVFAHFTESVNYIPESERLDGFHYLQAAHSPGVYMFCEEIPVDTSDAGMRGLKDTLALISIDDADNFGLYIAGVGWHWNLRGLVPEGAETAALMEDACETIKRIKIIDEGAPIDPINVNLLDVNGETLLSLSYDDFHEMPITWPDIFEWGKKYAIDVANPDA